MEHSKSVQETEPRTFTRSSKGTTKGSSVRMASCLSSDTDSGGDSTPTTTRVKAVLVTCARPGGLARLQDKQSYRTKTSQQGRGRGWGQATRERVSSVECQSHSTWCVFTKSHGKGDCHRAYSRAHRAEAERVTRPRDSPSRLDCRGPILPMRRNRHACLEAGTYSCVTCGAGKPCSVRVRDTSTVPHVN